MMDVDMIYTIDNMLRIQQKPHEDEAEKQTLTFVCIR